MINFSDVIKRSKEILGVEIDPSENQNLTKAMNNAKWDPFVDLE